MKTTVEIADDLLKQAQAMAAIRGQSFEDFVTQALQIHLARQTTEPSSGGWQNVFGKARREEVKAVDSLVAQEFGRVEPDEWL